MAFGKKALTKKKLEALQPPPVFLDKLEKQVLLTQGHMPTQTDHVVAATEEKMSPDEEEAALEELRLQNLWLHR